MSCNAGACLTAEREYSLIEIMRILKAVTTQIKHFHDNGYLYLDLKPNNIFLYPESLFSIFTKEQKSDIIEIEVRKHEKYISK